MLLAGVPAHYRLFSAPMRVDETAQKFIGHSRLFQHAVVVQGKMVLSGLHAGWHWVAEIDAVGSGSRGTVSAVPIHSHVAGGKPGYAADGRFGWMPGKAALKFGQRFRQGGRWATQRIYSVALSPSETSGHIEARLARLGWVQRAEDSIASGIGVWRRDAARLVLSIRAEAAGSVLFVHSLE